MASFPDPQKSRQAVPTPGFINRIHGAPGGFRRLTPHEIELLGAAAVVILRKLAARLG